MPQGWGDILCMQGRKTPAELFVLGVTSHCAKRAEIPVGASIGKRKESDRMNIIETENLTKTYGDFTAVSNVSLHIPKGSVYGFLGPNGA